MPIETICQNCARKLRVDEEYAGRKARCPHCKHVYTVPDSPDALSDAFASEPGELWRLRTEDGSVYGPVGKSELDSWLTEGRITADCQLQRDGDVQWQPAVSVYPALATTTTAHRKEDNPFADGSANTANPYTAPRTVNPTVRTSSYQPHRGGTILAFGIIGIACCIIFAPIAWVMGQSDLGQIKAGRMDPNGRSLTQAGMVLGIIGTVILAAQVIFGAIGIMAG